MKYLGSVGTIVLLLVVPAAVEAHHSSSAFDPAAEITVKGTVTRWAWINPHVVLQFDVKDDKGGVRTWACEGGNPANMLKQGWARTGFKPGDAVTVTLLPARNGEPAGILARVVMDTTGRAFVMENIPSRLDAAGRPISDDSTAAKGK